MMTGKGAGGPVVAVLHDPAGPHDPPDRIDSLDQAKAVAEALTRLGARPVLVPFAADLAAVRAQLESLAPAVVFNLAESLAGLERLAFCAAALAEALGIPCTGNSAAALLAATGKSAVKRRLLLAGLPTAQWLAHEPRPGDARPDFSAGPRRFLLKPEDEHGSVGVDEAAVVEARDADELLALLRGREAELGRPCLAEAFLPGREFAVSVLAGPDGPNAPEALPAAEMRFLDPGETALLTYASKWEEGSAAYAATKRHFPPEDALTLRLQDLALAVWRVLGLTGYARVDFRLDEGGAPQVMDVNANPCLAPDAGLAAAAGRAGLDFDALTGRILAAGVGWPGRAPAPEPAGDVAWRQSVRHGDAEAVRRLTAATGFFSAEEVAVAGELVHEHLAKGESSGYFFIFAEDRGGLAGYACYGPVPGTQDGYDLYWIAVAPERQGCGLGGRLLARAEADMAARGAGMIYAETASRGQYRSTRRFYQRHGYGVAARLAGFYAADDDKIIYHKRAGGATARPAHTEKS
jgi:D-alanine-D-alanine ligase-like ATP-grasp enzyme/ribosomal protein S18 acetylase RimI-like enzyme